VSVVVNPATGQGTQSLGGYFPINDILVYLITPGTFTRIDGHSPFRRIHQAAWIGLGATGVSPYPDLVVFGKFLEYEAEDMPTELNASNQVNTLMWDCTPGTSIYIEVFP
jgi:hypothetical protein